jgi:hypothetical protein
LDCAITRCVTVQSATTARRKRILRIFITDIGWKRLL